MENDPSSQQAESVLPGISASKQLKDYKTPEVNPALIKTPAPEKLNEYQSASVLMQAIADEAVTWRNSLPENFRPAIMAILHGGIQINVESLAQISFHGIRIAGTFNGSPCSMLAHQSTVQLLCYAEEIVENQTKNPIGFIWDGHKIEV